MPTAPKPNTSVPYSNKLPNTPAPGSLWVGDGPIVKSGSTTAPMAEDTGTAPDKG